MDDSSLEQMAAAAAAVRDAGAGDAGPAATGNGGSAAAEPRAHAGRGTVPSLNDLPADERAAILATALDAVPEIVWYKDTHNNILWANRAALARAGRSAEDLLGRSCFDLSPREGTEYFEQDLRVIETRQPMLGILHRLRRANGEREWVSTDKHPVLGADGQVRGIIAVSRYMPHPPAAAEPAASHAAGNLRLPGEMMRTDVSGAVTFVSDGCCRLLGLRADAALGQGWLSVVEEEDRAALERTWRAAVQERREIFDVRLRVRRPGETEPVALNVRAIREVDDDGEVLGFVANLSEPARTEDVSAEQNQRRLLDAMAATAPVGMFVSDAQGRCTYVNDRWCRIWGVERSEALSRGWIKALHPEDRDRVLLDFLTMTQAKRPYSGEFRVRHGDGRERWVLGRSVPLLDGNGEVIAQVGTATDITSRKLAEEEVRRLNRDLEARVAERTAELQSALKELEAFCYAVSHDLRAPLRALDGFSSALLEEFGDQLEGHGKDWLLRLRAGSQRMGRLIDDLLALSRLSRGSMRRERVDLTRIAQDVIEELRHTADARSVAVEIESGASCMGDPTLLRVVLQNLLGNAWKFTARTEHPRIEFGTANDEDGAPVFYVTDNGVGFDMMFADKLFGLFQRLHHPSEFDGTGIGLANVRRIIERHGGRVWAQGQPGAGATFYFTV
ncbi:MAG TPA: PAS domain S-box protein [Candidatus Limnocylindrales bacterium]|nr:PAS domain S-box protein [Candidatus Limnocylindrales bacterium]